MRLCHRLCAAEVRGGGCCWHPAVSWCQGESGRPGSGTGQRLGRQHSSALSLPREGSGPRLAEELRQSSAGAAVPRSVLSISCEPQRRQEPGSENQPLLLSLILGRLPSSRKHKAPPSIIHQVLTFIKEPPDTRAGCSTLLPGWESAGSEHPEGLWQEARPVPGVGGSGVTGALV